VTDRLGSHQRRRLGGWALPWLVVGALPLASVGCGFQPVAECENPDCSPPTTKDGGSQRDGGVDAGSPDSGSLDAGAGCFTCRDGGMVGGIGGDGKYYEAFWNGPGTLCPVYYSYRGTPFVHNTLDGAWWPIQEWGVSEATRQVSCR